MENKSKFKKILAEALKILRTSAALVVAVAVVSVIYAFFAHGRFWPIYVFDANLIVGAFVIGAGIITFAMPVTLKKSKLIDYTTHAPLHMEARVKKRARAYNFIYLGISNIVITVLAQYILSLIWR